MRLIALELLARKAIVARDKAATTEEKRQRLAEVLGELLQVYDWRRANLPPDHPDIWRALFNLPGTRVDLARNSPAEERASIYGTALQEYRKVYEWRRAYFGIDDVATCLNGQGIAGYYLALYHTSAPAGDRHAWLGEAAHATARGLQARQNVAWATEGMSAQVRDSAALLGKIALTLTAIGVQRYGLTKVIDEKDLDEVVKKVPAEAVELLSNSAAVLPDRRTGPTGRPNPSGGARRRGRPLPPAGSAGCGRSAAAAGRCWRPVCLSSRGGSPRASG